MLQRAGQAAGLGHVHPHMLRHGCGYRLVNQGANTRTIQDYLGHRDVPHTELYTEVDASRFRGLDARRRAGFRVWTQVLSGEPDIETDEH
jgi:site-specific recombinase XerD